MTDRRVVQDRIIEWQNRIDTAVRGIDHAVLESEPAIGDWSPSIVVAHLADSLELSLASGRAAVEDRPRPDSIGDNQQYNEARAAEARQRTWEQNSHSYHNQVELVAGFLSEIREADWELPVTYPWDEEGTVAGLFEDECGHQEEHCLQLQKWRETRDR